MSWDTSTLQIHHHGNHLTSTLQMHHHGNHLTLSENKNENFRSIKKHRENIYIYIYSFSVTQAFLLVLVSGPAIHEKSKDVFASYT